jgi:hypothetical protein
LFNLNGFANLLFVGPYTPTYQISLVYRKGQKSYDSDAITLQKYQLFDLKVKDERVNDIWYVVV